MTIRRVNGVDKSSSRSNSSNRSTPFFTFPRVHGEERGSKIRLERFEPTLRSSAAGGENHRQLFGRNDFKLRIRTVARLLVRAPPAKLRCVTETPALHVIVSDFDYKF